MLDSPKALRLKAMDLLARREHSRQELENKLLARGASRALMTEVLDGLVQDNLLSDERFAESYVRVRTSKGYGPQRIRQELQERGIESGLVDTLLEDFSQEWLTDLRNLWKKRWGAQAMVSREEQSKRWRFIQYRGYTWEQFKQVCEEHETIRHS